MSATALDQYALDHSEPLTEVQRNLLRNTHTEFGDGARRLLRPEVGQLLTFLARVLNARVALDVGTFTGYSALALALGLPSDGRVTTCEIRTDTSDLAITAWDAAGVRDRIALEIGPALETLRRLPHREIIDIAFVDADKAGYWGYHNEIVPRIRPNGLIGYDNVLFSGKVIDETATRQPAELREFNRLLLQDDRIDVIMLPIGDGVSLARKRAQPDPKAR